MYTFTIKDNGPDITVVVTRSLLALCAIASLVYHGDRFFYGNILIAVLFMIAAVFVNTLVTNYKITPAVILYSTAIGLFIATHSIVFAVIPAVAGLLIKKIYKAPMVSVNTTGISIKKMFGNPVHTWSEFNNIILKDKLLTLDFKDNKLLQLDIVDNGAEIDEGSFNNFCSGFIGI